MILILWDCFVCSVAERKACEDTRKIPIFGPIKFRSRFSADDLEGAVFWSDKVMYVLF